MALASRNNTSASALSKNIRACNFMLKKFDKKLIIINGDQMPSHRNESCGQKTMTLQENWSLFHAGLFWSQ